MGKRGNENAQMRREDYEAMESRGGGDEAPSGSFSKASDEVLKKRRIIRTSGYVCKSLNYYVLRVLAAVKLNSCCTS